MNASMSQNHTGVVGGNAHSFVCCDMDHGSSSRPRSTSPCPFEAYCCLDQHCASPAPCDDSCEPCPEKCTEPCPESCATEPCKDTCTKECQPCDDPQCPEPAAAWCPTTCTIEEYIQRCTDASCTLPQVELDPLALLAQQPLNQNYFDLVAQVFGTTTGGPQVTQQTVAPAATVATPLPLTHVCHWQNCHRSFDSMPILLAHIAADHLSAPGYEGSPGPLTSAAVTPQAQTHQQPAAPHSRAPSMDAFGALPSQSRSGQSDVFSCLWDDCFPFGVAAGTGTNTSGESTPHAHAHAQGMQDHSHAGQGQAMGHGQSLTHSVHNHGVLSPQTMLRHLLEDHLGVADVLQANADAHAHLVLTHTHANQHQHHQLPQHQHAHGHVHAHGPHDAHAHASTHAALGPHHHHPVAPVKLPPTPSPTPPGTSTAHVCLWPGCTVKEPFPSAGELMEHLSEVHIGRGRDSYRCRWDGCGGPEGRLFSSRQKVLRHLQSHTGHRPYVCSVCGQTFSEAAPLAAHMRRHADDKPFVCDHPGCGKAFAISSSLTIHKRTHNGDRPFVCPHCSKGFVEASNLTKHIRTHTGERPFACSHPGCGRRFSRPDQLKRHALVHDAAHKGRLAAKARA